MFHYVIVLKATVTLEGISYIAYPIIDRRTNTADKAIVENAVVNRYIRDNYGTLSDVQVVRTSVSRVEVAA